WCRGAGVVDPWGASPNRAWWHRKTCSTRKWCKCGTRRATLWRSAGAWSSVAHVVLANSASAPTRRDKPDSLYGTLVRHLAWAGGAPAAPPPLCVLDSYPSSRTHLAAGQPLQLCDAAQEPASRSPPAVSVQPVKTGITPQLAMPSHRQEGET